MSGRDRSLIFYKQYQHAAMIIIQKLTLSFRGPLLGTQDVHKQHDSGACCIFLIAVTQSMSPVTSLVIGDLQDEYGVYFFASYGYRSQCFVAGS